MPKRLSKTQKAALRDQRLVQEWTETNPFYRVVEEVQPELVKLARNMVRQAERLASRYEAVGTHITGTNVLAVAFDYAVKQDTQGKALPRDQAAARIATLWTMLSEGVHTPDVSPAEQAQASEVAVGG